MATFLFSFNLFLVDTNGWIPHEKFLSFGRNPKGLVPTLCEDGMPPVYESAVCVEYIDELAARSGGNSSLMPGSPAERAALRLKVDWINKILRDK